MRVRKVVMENLKNQLRNIMLKYIDLQGNKIEPIIIEQIIDKSDECDIEKFIKADNDLRPFARDYIDFCSMTVGIVSIYGSMNASEILKKHLR